MSIGKFLYDMITNMAPSTGGLIKAPPNYLRQQQDEANLRKQQEIAQMPSNVQSSAFAVPVKNPFETDYLKAAHPQPMEVGNNVLPQMDLKQQEPEQDQGMGAQLYNKIMQQNIGNNNTPQMTSKRPQNMQMGEMLKNKDGSFNWNNAALIALAGLSNMGGAKTLTDGLGQGAKASFSTLMGLREKDQQLQQQQQIEQSLIAQGYTPEQARIYARDPAGARQALMMKERAAQGDTNEFFSVQPQPYQMPDGTIKYVQIGSRGTIKEANLPNGGEFITPWDVSQRKTLGSGVGKGQGDNYKEIIKDANGALKLQTLYDSLEHSLEQGARTGWGSESLNNLKKIGLSIGVKGIDADKVGATETFEKIANQLALFSRNPASGLGMPGAISKFDINFLQSINPSLANTPQGNKMILDTVRLLNDRKISIAEMADKYYETYGKLDSGFIKEVSQYNLENPIFSSVGNSIANQQSAGQSGGASNGILWSVE